MSSKYRKSGSSATFKRIATAFKTQARTAQRRRTAPMRLPMQMTSRMQVPAALYSRGPERKVVDVGTVAGGSVFTSALNTTAVITLLGPLAQTGAAVFNRVGNKINVQSLHFRGEIVPKASGDGGAEYARGLIIYDRQPGAALPAIADILLPNFQDGAAAAPTSWDEINPANFERFKVIRDFRWDFPQNNAAATLGTAASCIDYTTNRMNINEYCRLQGLETHFKSSANPITVANIATGAFYLVTFGSKAAGVEGFQLAWAARFRYLDV